MGILTIILGVMLAICGFTCIFTPIATAMSFAYFLAILFIVYGITGIIRAIGTKTYGINFAFSIISVIACLVLLWVPGIAELTDAMLLYMVAVWFIIQGIVTIYTSVAVKKNFGGKKWIWGVVLGIIGILLGIFSCIHPLALAFSIGILIGIYFMESGITMIVMGAQMISMND